MKNNIKRVLSLIVFTSIILFSNIDATKLDIKKGTNSIYTIDVVKKTDNIIESPKSLIVFYEKNKEEIKNYLKEQRINYKTKIVKYAKQFVGNPYVTGGNSLVNGTDCSGFVKLIYAKYGVSLPRTAPAQSSVGEGVSINDIEIGDIISYGYNGFSSHSALYIGDGKIVHASTPELGIRIDDMHIMPIITIRRVI